MVEVTEQSLHLGIDENICQCTVSRRVDAFRPKGHGFDSRSSRHVGTLGKFFTHSACGASTGNSGTVGLSVLCRERL